MTNEVTGANLNQYLTSRLSSKAAIQKGNIEEAMEQPNNWGPAALIVFGYIVAAFWQNKRIEDLKTWLDSEFKHINEKLDKLDTRVKTLEDARGSGIIGSFR